MRQSQSKKRKRLEAPELAEAEWNFEKRKLPDGEVFACYFYEYSREFAKTSEIWQNLVAKLEAKQKLPQGHSRRRNIGPLLRRITKLFPRNPALSLMCRKSAIDTPWYELGREDRDLAIKEVGMLKKLSEPFQEDISLEITLERDLPEWGMAGVKGFDDWALIDRCWHGDDEQRERGFFAVNWDYTDDLLKRKFKQWLDEKRGTQKAKHDARGESKYRAHLKALGAKRLLDAGFTAKEAIEYTDRILKAGVGFSAPLYHVERTWSVAKNRTVPMVLARMFPSSRRRENRP